MPRLPQDVQPGRVGRMLGQERRQRHLPAGHAVRSIMHIQTNVWKRSHAFFPVPRGGRGGAMSMSARARWRRFLP